MGFFCLKYQDYDLYRFLNRSAPPRVLFKGFSHLKLSQHMECYTGPESYNTLKLRFQLLIKVNNVTVLVAKYSLESFSLMSITLAFSQSH